MTIGDIAAKLNNCADHRCQGCKYMYVDDPEECKSMLIKEMGAEVEKIGQQMLDDRK